MGLFSIEKPSGVSSINLKQVGVTADKDAKSSKQLIRIELSETQSMILECKSKLDYETIKASTDRAQEKKAFEDLNTEITKLEKEMSEIERRNIEAYLSGIDEILRSEDGRMILFQNFEDIKSEYKYLGKLYDVLNQFTLMSQLRRHTQAYNFAKQVYETLANPTLEEIVEEEKKQGEPIEIFVMPKDDSDGELAKKVREMLKEIANEEALKKIKETLDLINKDGVANTLEKGIGNTMLDEVKANFRKKMESIYLNEMLPKPEEYGKISREIMRLLTLPITRYKANVRWKVPRVANGFGERRTAPASLLHLNSFTDPIATEPRTVNSFTLNRSTTTAIPNGSNSVYINGNSRNNNHANVNTTGHHFISHAKKDSTSGSNFLDM